MGTALSWWTCFEGWRDTFYVQHRFRKFRFGILPKRATAEDSELARAMRVAMGITGFFLASTGGMNGCFFSINASGR